MPPSTRRRFHTYQTERDLIDRYGSTDYDSLQKAMGPRTPSKTPFNITDPFVDLSARFAEQIEQTYIRNRGKVNLSSLMQYDPEDLVLMDEEMLRTMADQTVTHRALLQQQAKMQEEAATRAQKRLDADRTKQGAGNFFVRALTLGALGVPESARRYENMTVEDLIPEELAALQREYMDAAMGREGPAEEAPNVLIGSPQLRAAVGRTEGQEGIKANAMQFLSRLPVGGLLWVAKQWENVRGTERPAQEAAFRDQQEALFQEQVALQATASFEQTSPEVQNFYVTIANGDRNLATTLFFAGVGGEGAAREFQQLMQSNIDQETEVFMQELEANEFRSDGSALDVLSTWGRLTADLATGVSLLVTDDEMRDFVGRGDFRSYLDAIAETDGKPSTIWGLNDTFAGIAIDFGLSAIFDPTTWLFAPARGAAGFRQFSTPARVRGWLGSPSGNRAFKDLFDTFAGTATQGPRRLVGQLSMAHGMPWQWRSTFMEAAETGNEALARKAFEDAILIGGWKPGQVDRLAWSQYIGGIMRHTLADPDNKLSEVVFRFMTPENITTTLPMHGATWVDDILENFARISGAVGDDLGLYEEFAGEFIPMIRGSYATDTAALRQAQLELASMGAEVDLYRALAGGDVRRLEEGITLGGQTFDDLDGAISFLDSQIGASSPLSVERIISGGQTGADRAGLEVGKRRGLQTGGTAPKGFRTEAGPDTTLSDFGLTESPAGNYSVRTVKNVEDADATVVFDLANSTGSRQTVQAAQAAGKPFLHITNLDDADAVVAQLQEFLQTNNVRTLNVAGNRASVTEGIQSQVEGLLDRALTAPVSDDVARLRGQRDVLTSVRDRIRGPEGPDIIQMGELAKLDQEAFVAKYAGEELAPHVPRATLASDGFHTSSGLGTASSTTKIVTLNRAGMTRGQVILQYNSDGQLVNFTLRTSKESGQDAIALGREAMRMEPQLNAVWLARNVGRVSLSPDGARLAHAVITRGARDAIQGAWGRTQLATAIPKHAEAAARVRNLLQGTGQIGVRNKIAETYLRYLEKLVANDDVFKKIPGLVDPDGKVNWSVIGTPDPLAQLTKRGMLRHSPDFRALPRSLSSMENTITQVLYPLNDAFNIRLPVSALDLVTARTIMSRILQGQIRGSRRITKAFSEAWNDYLAPQLRQKVIPYMEAAHRFWMYDKVLRPATAATVHLDEFYRIIHEYGTPAAGAYMTDRAAGVTSRMDRGLQRLTRGSVRLPSTVSDWARDRLTRGIEAIPRAVKAQERSLLERTGDGIFDLKPGHPLHLDAGRRFTSWFLEDKGFRRWRMGQFEDFWNSPDAAWLKEQTVMDFGSRTPRAITGEDVQQMYANLWNRVLMRGAKDPGATATTWDDAIRRVEAGGRSVEMPDWVITEFGEIPAFARDPSGFHPLETLSEVFDSMFLFPTRGRQGLISRLEKMRETKRLESLYTSQGYRIVEGAEMERLALQMGLVENPTTSRAVGNFIDERLLQAKLIPRHHIEALAERAATQQIDKIMYSWHLTSPAGKAARIAAPFGKPWADMWKYWMTELMSKPVLRGAVMNENHQVLSNWMDQVLRNYPVGILPNRGTATISRVANTDFDLENQNINVRVPWPVTAAVGALLGGAGGAAGALAVGGDINIEGVDLSPIVFMPHRGENPYFSLIPGMGLVPFTLIDWMMPSPDDKENWNAFQEFLAEDLPVYVPSVDFGHPSVSGRYLGGGWASFFLRSFGAQSMRINHTYPYSITEATTDVGAAAQAVRDIKADLGDPQVWENILGLAAAGLGEKELVDTLIESYVFTALEDAGSAQQQKLLLRQLLPGRFDTDPSLEDIEEIWLTAGGMFPALIPERDRLRFEQMGNSAEDRATMANIIRDEFYNMPVEERDLLVIQYPGLAAQLVAGWTWNAQKIDQIPGLEATLPFRHTPGQSGLEKFAEYKKQGWLVPRSAKEVLISAIGYYFNTVDRATRNVYTQTVRALNDSLGLTGTEDAFFDGWRSNNVIDGQFNQDLLSYVFDRPVSDVAPGAQQLGINLGDTWSVRELVEAIHGKLQTARQNPLHSLTVAPYLLEADIRNSGRDLDLSQIAQVDQSGQGESYTDAWVSFYRNVNEEIQFAGDTAPHVQEMIGTLRDAYAWMAHAYPGFLWRTVWDRSFARDFGPWPEDWKPPVPPEGDPRDNRGFQPYIWNVVDGDTLQVSQNAQQGLTFRPTLLPGEVSFGEESLRTPQAYEVRILGFRAPEYSDPDTAPARAAHEELFRALQSAPPGSIWLVPDERFPEVDQFGRRLAWLWVDGQYLYDEQTMYPTDPQAFDVGE